MPDRLSDLQRQRALLQEHLAWLDREIAQTASAGPSTPPPSEGKTATNATLTASVPGQPVPPPSPLVPAEGPQETAGAMAADAKRGCLIAFAVGMVLFFALVLGAYFITRSGS